ncbi:MAG: 50S ribosomal protein L25/general stress protein Ctc [Gammaproteobacteria bacterium]|nr:MAG: 50S ribosomal protein L25/general stress protein Ctc [Gammaproteobacteria bacterium]
MAKRFSLAAEPREGAGKGASRRLRRTGKVPGILYGGGQQPAPVMMDNNELLRNAEQEAFFSSILDVNLGGEHLQAIVKGIQVHPARRAIVHLDLQRVLATEKIRMTIPLHFLNQASARGVKEGGGVIQHLMTEVEISCLPKHLPEFLTLDVAELDLNKNLHLSDILLPEGVEILALAAGVENDRPVVSIHTVREEVEEAAAATAEGAVAEGAAAPAEGGAAAAPGAAAKPGAAPAKAAAPAAKEAKGKEKK